MSDESNKAAVYYQSKDMMLEHEEIKLNRSIGDSHARVEEQHREYTNKGGMWTKGDPNLLELHL